MPKLGKYSHLLRTIAFLYPTAEDANRGSNFGGTAFLVGIRSKASSELAFVYAVSNWHVAVGGGASVLRLNRKDGGVDTLEFGPENWEWTPDGPDVAAVLIPFQTEQHDHKLFELGTFALSDEQIAEAEIGAGDDVFMIGRFVDYDGIETNEPSVRFGNISIMNAEVRQPTGYSGASVIIDMHSRSGYSGSPVFVFRNSGSLFGEKGEFAMGHMVQLLGIHWGQFPELWELKEGTTGDKFEGSLVRTGQYVKGLSGMTCVSPAKTIVDLLDHPSLAKHRKAVDGLVLAKKQLPPETGASI